jgi:hypothetical protein
MANRRGRPKGSPDLLNEELMAAIIDALKSGTVIEDAAAYVGVSERTVYRWLARGRDEISRREAFPETDNPAEEDRYVNFCQEVEKARAAARLRAVGVIQRAAAEGTWQAAAWYLERSAPKQWARQTKHEVTGNEGGPVRIDVSTDDLERKIARITEQRKQAT